MNVIREETLKEIAEMTTNKVMVKLIYLDVMPNKLYRSTLAVMDHLVAYGLSGRELDDVGLHHEHLGDLTGKSTTESHRTRIQTIVDNKGRNHSYLTSRGRVRGEGVSKDYATALKLQLILKLLQNDVSKQLS